MGRFVAAKDVFRRKIAASRGLLTVAGLGVVGWLSHRWQSMSSIALTLAAVAGVWIAFEGLQTWKRQLRGSEDHELAKGMLRTMQKLEDRFAWLRYRHFRLTDQQIGSGGVSVAVRGVYEQRWKEFLDEASQLGALLDEASIVWDDRFKKLRGDLGQLVNEVRSALEDYLLLHDTPQSADSATARETLFGGDETDSIGTSFACFCEVVELETKKKLIR